MKILGNEEIRELRDSEKESEKQSASRIVTPREMKSASSLKGKEERTVDTRTCRWPENVSPPDEPNSDPESEKAR